MSLPNRYTSASTPIGKPTRSWYLCQLSAHVSFCRQGSNCSTYVVRHVKIIRGIKIDPPPLRLFVGWDRESCAFLVTIFGWICYSKSRGQYCRKCYLKISSVAPVQQCGLTALCCRLTRVFLAFRARGVGAVYCVYERLQTA